MKLIKKNYNKIMKWVDLLMKSFFRSLPKIKADN